MIDIVILPLAGGILIGLAAGAFLLVNGRIAGISGIVGGAFSSSAREASWRYAFVGGLLAGGFLLWLVMPSAFPQPTTSSNQSLGVLIVAGLLVGIGTRLGSGCTSGHGVCGIARFSPRSLSATLMFIATGALAVIAARFFGVSP